MFRNTFRLFPISGIMLKADASWLLIVALIVWSLATRFFPLVVPNAGLVLHLSLAVIGAFLLFASLIVHELAHAVTARRLGLKIRGITLFLFGGVAELGSEPKRARDEFVIAIVGPLASLGLAIGFYIASGLISEPAIHALLTYLTFVNGALAVFNLIPAFPMDGGRVLRAFLWWRSGSIHKATLWSAGTGTIFGGALIAYGVYRSLTNSGIGDFWLVLIGFFIFASARANLSAARMRLKLGAMVVSDLMATPTVAVRPEMTIQELVENVMAPRRITFVPVIADGQVLGFLDGEAIRARTQADWPRLQVTDLMQRANPGNAATPDQPAEEALDRMLQSGSRQMLVLDRGALVGILSLADLSAYLRYRRRPA